MTRDDIIPFLSDLKNRNKTNKAVAKALGVAPETVSRVLKQLAVVKIPGKTKTRKAEIKQKTKKLYEERRAAALTLDIYEAMEVTGLSERSIRRWRKR